MLVDNGTDSLVMHTEQCIVFSDNLFDPINEVTLRRAGLVLGRVTDCLRAGKLSQYVTSCLGQLSLPSL